MDSVDHQTKTILAAIYFDIETICFLRGFVSQAPQPPDVNRYVWDYQGASTLVSQAVTQALGALSYSFQFTQQQQDSKRLMELTRKLGWKILSICAHSEAFRRAFKEADVSVWNEVVNQIDANRLSIELFARTRNLEWRGPLLKHAKHPLPELQEVFVPYRKLYNGHFYHFVRTSNGSIRRPTFDGFTQVHIDNCVFDPRGWRSKENANGKIVDPTLRCPENANCYLCDSGTSCPCEPPRLPGQLVELVDYPNKGVGVRVLTNFRKGDILAEYVGEIHPPSYNEDATYALPLFPNQGDEVAAISSRRFGNWTRFINHCCDPSTQFREIIIGDRFVAIIQAVRNINIFEELTIHYGNSYWKDRVCRCGASNCLSLTRDAIGTAA